MTNTTTDIQKMGMNRSQIFLALSAAGSLADCGLPPAQPLTKTTSATVSAAKSAQRAVLLRPVMILLLPLLAHSTPTRSGQRLRPIAFYATRVRAGCHYFVMPFTSRDTPMSRQCHALDAESGTRGRVVWESRKSCERNMR